MNPLAQRRSGTPATGGGLVILRSMFISFIVAPILFIVAFSFLTSWERGDDGASPLVVAALCGASIIAARSTARRPLDPRSPATLATSYRTRAFAGVLFATIASFGAVVLSFVLSNSLWLIALGAVATEVGLWFVAPSRRNLAADQERLRAQGSSLDLVTVLSTPPRDRDVPE